MAAPQLWPRAIRKAYEIASSTATHFTFATSTVLRHSVRLTEGLKSTDVLHIVRTLRRDVCRGLLPNAHVRSLRKQRLSRHSIERLKQTRFVRQVLRLFIETNRVVDSQEAQFTTSTDIARLLLLEYFSSGSRKFLPL